MKLTALVILFAGLLLFQAPAKKISSKELQTGDFLLCRSKKEGLSGAIDRVTNQNDAKHYSHIALIEKSADGIWVLHAATENGSERILLADFLSRRSAQDSIDVFRLKKEYLKSVPHAIRVAKTLLHRPYNYSYVLNDSSLYCSDFVERCFAEDSIFELKPMSFVNPKTQKTDTVWLDFYKKQGIPVPEGKLGCNPNGLAHSEKIQFIGTLN